MRAFCYIGLMPETIIKNVGKEFFQKDQRPSVGVGVVIWDRGKVLLGKRKGSHGAGEWSLPGGKVDPDETPNQAASRELYEETNITVVGSDFIRLPFWSFDSYPEIDRNFVTLYFAHEWPQTVPRLREPEKCEYWEFVSWNKIHELDKTFCGLTELSELLPNLGHGKFCK